MDTAKRGEHATQALKGSRFREVRWVESVGSTNTDLMAKAVSGEAGGLVLVADYQSSGRGRRERVWEAPPGASLLFSMLLRPENLTEHAALVTMAAGVASVEACRAVTGVVPRLKWPNDMLVEGKKLSGMLSETVVAGTEITALVIGIGINTNWPPDLPVELAETATSLNFHLPSEASQLPRDQLPREAGKFGREKLPEKASPNREAERNRETENLEFPTMDRQNEEEEPVDRVALLVALLRSMDELVQLIETEVGRAELLDRYKSHLGTLGREVRVVLADSSFTGTALDVDSAGSLLVRNDEQERWVSVADVVHLR